MHHLKLISGECFKYLDTIKYDKTGVTVKAVIQMKQFSVYSIDVKAGQGSKDTAEVTLLALPQHLTLQFYISVGEAKAFSAYSAVRWGLQLEGCSASPCSIISHAEPLL